MRTDFRPDSDVDFLAVFDHDDYGPWMGKLIGLETELSTLLDRKVDLVSRKGVRERLRACVEKDVVYV